MFRHSAHLALTYGIGAASGYAFSLIHFPLAWMIGSAIAVATAASLGWPGRAPRITRSWGQIIVAASIGLFMTADAIESVIAHMGIMIGAAVFTIIAGLAVAGVFMRVAKVDAVTACLACVPVGPMEGMRLAERYDANPVTVAFAQAIRIMALVVTIPPTLLFFSGWPRPPAGGAAIAATDTAGVLLLLAGSSVCGGLAARLGIPNGAFLGALGFSAVAAFLSLPVHAPPNVVLVIGQLLLGVSLGSMFDNALVSRLGAFALASLGATAGLVLLCLVGAGVTTYVSGLPWQTLILATAPGSLTEMSLTARLMHFDVPLVTSFHILRISIILLLTPAVFRLVKWIAKELGT